MTDIDFGASVRLAGVSKSFGQASVLSGVDLELAPGELICMLGPSGCGKTTALRCIAGLESPSSGRIFIGGEDVTGLPVNKRDIGMVFQQYSLFPHMSVRRNVEFGLSMRGVVSSERAARVGEMLDVVGLTGFGDRFPHELSGGQQQRVALARALVTRPRALLLDEPLSALDAKVRVRLREQIREIQTELGITTVFVTHDQEEALAISDRVAVMHGGGIAQLGTPEELYQRPVNAFVANFVGLSNKLAGSLVRGRACVRGASLRVLEHSVRGVGEGKDVTVFVRPEFVRLCHVGAAAVPVVGGESFVVAPSSGEIFAVVVSSGFFGPVRRTIVEFADGEQLAVQHSAVQVFRTGERVRVEFADVPVTVESR